MSVLRCGRTLVGCLLVSSLLFACREDCERQFDYADGDTLVIRIWEKIDDPSGTTPSCENRDGLDDFFDRDLEVSVAWFSDSHRCSDTLWLVPQGLPVEVKRHDQAVGMELSDADCSVYKMRLIPSDERMGMDRSIAEFGAGPCRVVGEHCQDSYFVEVLDP